MNETHDQPVPDEGATRPLSFYDEPPPEAPVTTTYDEPDRRTHPLSVGHLVAGLVFLGIAGSWALRQLGVIESDGQQWVLPLVLVVAGGAGLLALLAKGMTGRRA